MARKGGGTDGRLSVDAARAQAEGEEDKSLVFAGATKQSDVEGSNLSLIAIREAVGTRRAQDRGRAGQDRAAGAGAGAGAI